MGTVFKCTGNDPGDYATSAMRSQSSTSPKAGRGRAQVTFTKEFARPPFEELPKRSLSLAEAVGQALPVSLHGHERRLAPPKSPASLTRVVAEPEGRCGRQESRRPQWKGWFGNCAGASEGGEGLTCSTGLLFRRSMKEATPARGFFHSGGALRDYSPTGRGAGAGVHR